MDSKQIAQANESINNSLDLTNVSDALSWTRIEHDLDESNEKHDETLESSIHIDQNELDNMTDLSFAPLNEKETSVSQSNSFVRRVAITRQSNISLPIYGTDSNSNENDGTETIASTASNLDEDDVNDCADLQNDSDNGNDSYLHVDQLFIDEEERCSICLEEFQLNEYVRQMNCKHSFHAMCIDQWLTTRTNCPICRKRLNSDSNDDSEDAELEDADFDYDGVSDRMLNEDFFSYIIHVLENDETQADIQTANFEMNSLEDIFQPRFARFLQATLDRRDTLENVTFSFTLTVRNDEISESQQTNELTDEQTDDYEETTETNRVQSTRLIQIRNRVLKRKRNRRTRVFQQARSRSIRRALIKTRPNRYRGRPKQAHFSKYAKLNRFRFN